MQKRNNKYHTIALCLGSLLFCFGCISRKGEKRKYDQLVIATGSAPFVPPIEGVDKKGVLVYRTIEDL
ncbi:MAG: FAD-dependent oxidoreductase, partial [Bacteroidota bacterium]